MRTSVAMSKSIYHKIDKTLSVLDFFVNRVCKDLDKREALKLRIQQDVKEICGISI